MKSLAEINSIISNSSEWVYGEDQITVHLLSTSVKYLTHEELRLVDPRLPSLVQALPAEKEVDGVQYKDGYTVYITVEYWNDFEHTVVDTTGKTLVLGGIESIDDTSERDSVIFYAHVYEELSTCRAQVGGFDVDIPYASNFGYGNHHVDKGWLAKHLPNRKAAWHAIETLGIETQERQRYLMNSAKSAEMTNTIMPADVFNT